MGRGNVCVFGEYEGLFYVDWNNFPSSYEDENGTWHTDNYYLQKEDWEMSLKMFTRDFINKFKSFYECDSIEYMREGKVLENSLFYIVVEDNQWSQAIKLIQKEQEYGQGNLSNLQKRHYQKYLDGMKECLFNQFDELGVYAGAWTSGTIKKVEAA